MSRKLNLGLFLEVGFLISTIFSVLSRGIPSSYSERLTFWFLIFFIGVIVYSIYLFNNNIKAEIVKAFCSTAISMILILNLTDNQGFIDIFVLFLQCCFSFSIFYNLVKNFRIYQDNL